MLQDNIDWLNGLAPQATAQEGDDEKQQKKNAIFSKLSGDIALLREKMIENSKIKVSNSKGKKQKIVNYAVRDQMTEFDMDEMRDGYALGQVIDQETMTTEEINVALEDTADMEKHLETKRIVETMIRQIEQEQGVTLDKEDLMEEVYQPLLRQGLIGETFIPNEFSQTKNMLENVFEEYGKRLEEEKSKGFWDENKELIIATAGSVIGAAGSGANIGASAQFSANGAPSSSWGVQSWNAGLTQTNANGTLNTGVEANTIAGYVGMGLTALTMAADAPEDVGKMIGGEKEKDPAGRISLAPKIGRAVASGLAAQLGTELGTVGLGPAASSSFGASLKVPTVGLQLGAKEFAKSNVEAVRDLASVAYSEVMTRIDPGDDPTLSIALSQAGTAMASKFTAATSVDDIFNALQETETHKVDANKAVQLFLKAGADAIAVGISSILPKLQDPGAKDKITKKVNQQLSDEFLAEVSDKDKKAQEEMEDLEVVGDVSTEASRIDKKIAALEREQALLKWSFGVAGLGMQVASQVLAPLAIAGSAIALAQNLIEAGKRARDSLVFIESRKGMLNAASAYYPAVDRFVTNANMQLLHYSANAAFQVASMIGAILQCTGILAAAGAGVSAGAGLAQAIEAVVYAARKRMDLETAWTQYKLALSRPENRKLGLIAIRSNATLAKFAVAWGAVIKKDPLVKDFIHDCGLDAKNIEDDTKTADVVRYLETRMPDDIVVVGRKFPSADFAPSPIELTADCWASAKGRAVAKAQMMPQDSRSLDSALERFGVVVAELPVKFTEMKNQITTATPPAVDTPVAKALISECQKQIQLCEDTIQESKTLLSLIKTGFGGFNPRLADENGKNVGDHGKMRAVIGDFLSLVTESSQALDQHATQIQAQKDLIGTWVPA